MRIEQEVGLASDFDVVEQDEAMMKDITSTEKWILAAILGLIFSILTTNTSFVISDGFLKYAGIRTVSASGHPTPIGWTVHLIVFVLLVRVLMK